MIAKHLIAHDIPSISVAQTGKDAFHLLSDHHVKHLPVVDGKQLVGIISEEDIFNHKLYEPISEYDFSLLRRFAVREQDHIFEIMRVMGDNRLTVIPVIDNENNYLGLITQNQLLRFFANTSSFSEPGGILVLEMNRRDYVLATIARIAEEEDLKILGVFINSAHDPEMIEVTLKFNRHDLGRVISSYERHEFTVMEIHGGQEYTDSLQERYDSFMNYLNM